MRFDPTWLPAGWTAEPYPNRPELVVIFRSRQAGGGIITIDTKLRRFSAGHCIPYAFPSHDQGFTPSAYAGRGWLKLLTREACVWLESVMA